MSTVFARLKKKGLLAWLQETQPDIITFQETKAQPEQIDDAVALPGGLPYLLGVSRSKGLQWRCASEPN